jgi:CheY-like chemotaxis protein
LTSVNRTVLLVSRSQEFVDGMSRALIRFGYQVMTCSPDPRELDRMAGAPLNLVLLQPPEREAERRPCLDLIRMKFLARGVPVLVNVATSREAMKVQKYARGVHLMQGNPIRMNDLYTRLLELLELAGRQEMRINTELQVAHREVGVGQDDYYQDMITSLSADGCFIRTAHPYPVGRRIETQFRVGDAALKVSAQGSVVHHGLVLPGMAPLGMGVRFEGVSPESRALLQSYLIDQLVSDGVSATF